MHAQGPYNRGVEWPMTLVGVISAILLAGGLIPPYFEIAKRHGRVVGISMQHSPRMSSPSFRDANRLCADFVFLSVDWLGAFFSLMALGTSPPEPPRLTNTHSPFLPRQH